MDAIVYVNTVMDASRHVHVIWAVGEWSPRMSTFSLLEMFCLEKKLFSYFHV